MVVDQSAYVGSAHGALDALDVASGAINCRTTLCCLTTSSAVADGEPLYVGGTDGILSCLNQADGTVHWRFGAAGPIVVKPLVTADHVVFGSSGGKNYAVHRGT